VQAYQHADHLALLTRTRVLSRGASPASPPRIADAFIARNNDPILFTDGGQPLWIESVLSEMIVVYFDVETRCAKDRGHFVTAKLPVEKED
jgi:hypothetical protein